MKFLPISNLCEMKARRQKLMRKPAKPLARRAVLAPGADEPHTVRARMLKRGKELLKDKTYPRNTVVKELAALFASKFLAERN